MPEQNLAYNDDIKRWGNWARAVKAIPALLQRLDDEGITPAEITAIDTSEQEAREADAAQQKAQTRLSLVTPKIKEKVAALEKLFAVLRLRLPNAIGDLEEAGKAEEARAGRQVKFTGKAIPRVPKAQSAPLAAATTADTAPAAPAPKPVEDTESRAQKAIGQGAIDLAHYLKGYPELVSAIVTRKAPATFHADLEAEGQALLDLRTERMLALAAQKQATKAEHAAVAAHRKARRKAEPTATALARSDAELDALMVEHLARKPSFKKKSA